MNRTLSVTFSEEDVSRALIKHAQDMGACFEIVPEVKFSVDGSPVGPVRAEIVSSVYLSTDTAEANPPALPAHRRR